jgi:MarR family transcriptional regulator for hemolysin
MAPPSDAPLGLRLSRTARLVGRAFDAALVDAGGSVPSWLIMISLKGRDLRTQRDLADAVGIRSATLTHHLDALEGEGLVARRRDPQNRRVQRVELTEAGEAAFLRMREAAMAFDHKLRQGLSGDDLTTLARVLDQLVANVCDGSSSQ